MSRARSAAPSAAGTRRGRHRIPRSGRPRTHRNRCGRRSSGNGPSGSWTTPAHGEHAHWSADRSGLPSCAGLRVTLIPHVSMTASFTCGREGCTRSGSVLILLRGTRCLATSVRFSMRPRQLAQCRARFALKCPYLAEILDGFRYVNGHYRTIRPSTRCPDGQAYCSRSHLPTSPGRSAG
jgi:hypothetical protein